MDSDIDRYLDLIVENPVTGETLNCKALLDTGASFSGLPRDMVNILKLAQVGVVAVRTATTERQNLPLYLADLSIQGRKFKHCSVLGLPNHAEPLVGWDVISQGTLLPSISSKLVDGVAHLLNGIPDLKKTMVLVLGQDTTEIHRLRAIQNQLGKRGYTTIILKDQTDIDVQSIEEKVNMLASLCRFVVCDNSVASGHIDELKICSLNRFVTAIVQQVGTGATWMQADYKLDFAFINDFSYKDIADIPSSVDQAIAWAEIKLAERKTFFDNLYSWRKP